MQKGQALLMMLLILGVAITVGLSVVSRSVTDVNLTGTEDQSAKALQAAEAGVEKAWGGVYPINSQSGLTNVGGAGSAEFNVKTDNLTINASSNPGHDYYKVPYDLNAGDVTTINLKTYGDTNLAVCWGTSGSGEGTSVELILYYTSGGSIHATRIGYSPSGSALSGFTVINDNDGNKCPHSTFEYSQRVSLGSLASNYEFLRIRVIGNTTAQPVAVAPYGSSLPSQGKEITSTGQSGDTAQKVHVLQPTADLPFMFDSALFSGSTLSQ